LDTHIVGQRAYRELYYRNQQISKQYPEKMLYIIHDKIDHSKTTLPHFSYKTKATDSFMRIPVAIMGMIAHSHDDTRYAHYGIGFFPTNSNHTIGSIAKLLCDLKAPPKNSSQMLFSEEDNQSTLTKATRWLKNLLRFPSSTFRRTAFSSTTPTNINFATRQCIRGQQEPMGFCFFLFVGIQRHFP